VSSENFGAPAPATAHGRHAGPHLQDFILYCGAGVYEELVFRVFLLGLLILVLTKLFHMEHAYAAAWSVLLGAIIFSAFHHVGGEAFNWGRFLQRAFAGLYFAALYVNRSFGIAAASHALYDVVVGLNYLELSSRADG
jgi:membrane protease YdiL (CAAX protease family)